MTLLRAIFGWGYAAYYRAALALARRELAAARSAHACAKLDLHFATEKLAEFANRMNRAECELERLRTGGGIAAAALKRRAN